MGTNETKTPIEELLYILSHGSEREKTIAYSIVDQLDRKWREEIDFGAQSVGKLLNLLDDKPSSNDLEVTEYILELIIRSFQGEGTLSILINTLTNMFDTFNTPVFIGWFASQARRAVPTLIRYSGDIGVGPRAFDAIRRIGVTPNELFSGLKDHIESQDGLGFSQLLCLTKEVAPESICEPAFKQILELGAKNNAPGVRESVVEIIQSFGRETKSQFRSILEEMTLDLDDYIREEAFEALRSLE